MTHLPLSWQTSLIFILLILFFVNGAIVDYWQASLDHQKKLHPFFKKYFALFWLILHNGLLPLSLVVVASNFNPVIIKIYLMAFLLGTLAWDLIFSILYYGKAVHPVAGYWYWGGRDYSTTSTQLYVFHFLRLLGVLLIARSL